LADQLRTKGQSSPSFAAEALHLAALAYLTSSSSQFT
jgi:hypothetical protein